MFFCAGFHIKFLIKSLNHDVEKLPHAVDQDKSPDKTGQYANTPLIKLNPIQSALDAVCRHQLKKFVGNFLVTRHPIPDSQCQH
jgi:hypothetical protein